MRVPESGMAAAWSWEQIAAKVVDPPLDVIPEEALSQELATEALGFGLAGTRSARE